MRWSAAWWDSLSNNDFMNGHEKEGRTSQLHIWQRESALLSLEVWQTRNPLPSKWVSCVRLLQIEVVCFEKHLSMDICPEDPPVWSLSPINWTVWLHLGIKVARCVLDHAGCCSPMPPVQMFPSYGDATVWSFNTCWYLEQEWRYFLLTSSLKRWTETCRLLN